MTSNPQKLYSVKEYFEIEKNSDKKHEFVYGDVFLMTGASEKHNSIARNIVSELHQNFKQRGILNCKPYVADMRTKINAHLYRYPDVVVGCNIELETIDGLETLVNPVLVIEILSSSTARFDRSAKFQEYQQINSLRYYLLVAQNQINVTLFTKEEAGIWSTTQFTYLDDFIELPLISSRLQLADIYWAIHL